MLPGLASDVLPSSLQENPPRPRSKLILRKLTNPANLEKARFHLSDRSTRSLLRACNQVKALKTCLFPEQALKHIIQVRRERERPLSTPHLQGHWCRLAPAASWRAIRKKICDTLKECMLTSPPHTLRKMRRKTKTKKNTKTRERKKHRVRTNSSQSRRRI